jgi:ADP-heptose:LPS heptosyltransferase
MRVLVIFPGALGDLICFMPVLRALALRHHGTSIELMARAELARFAIGRMGVAAGHSIDRREVSCLFRDQSELDPFALGFFQQFDAIYSFFAANDANFRRRLTATTDGVVSFHPFRPDGTGHISKLYLDGINASGSQLDTLIDLAPSDLESAHQLLYPIGMARKKYCLIFPGSGGEAKNWELNRFLRLATEISPLVTPLAILGPAEVGMTRTFCERGIATFDDLDLPTVAALSHLSAGFVGNDSGVSHLAAASGARGVVIFGPTDPARWRPRGDIKVLRGDPLETLQVAEVLNIVHSRLVS